jgi:uncharacterized membrane protein YkvA (DUF1232 family)
VISGLAAAVGSSGDGGASIAFWPWGLLLICVGLYAIAVAAFLAAGRREDARAVAAFIPDCLILVGRLARDPRISPPRRAALWLVLAYLALPIDLIPDFIPIAGLTDDAVLLAVALRVLVRGADPAMIRAAWPGPEASLKLILRAAGMESNGSGSPTRQATLRP